ncbi:hypothetical protein [Paraflavitalea speifideaquila]|uniref:hypothetical protein n=1 Tax=Paraflavitalea speifideaquila TaxID=3076558 RepID=UPI0028E54B38|nr:hypothetical protein [Paraflavitalea speifideiaquila]
MSYVGYATRQLPVDSLQQNAQVWLSPSDNSLDAVVVTALGVSNKRSRWVMPRRN